MSDQQPPTSRRAARDAATARMAQTPLPDDPQVVPPALPPVVIPPVGSTPAPPAPPSDPARASDGSRLGRPTRVQWGIIIGAAALVFILLCTGSVFLGIHSAHRTAATTSTSGNKIPARVVPVNQVEPTTIPTCSLDSLATAPALIKLSGSVVNTATGLPIYSLAGTSGAIPATTIKVLTASAAIAALGPTYQITTSVDETAPGTIVLIGQGDATLSALAAGQSVYAGAPTLASLASKTLAAYNADSDNAGIPITNVILDSTYWSPTDDWDTSWPATLRSGGLLSYVTALQVDGDRANGRAQVSARSADPITAAGNAFVTALGLTPGSVTVTKGATPSGAAPLASVQSQPVSTLVKQMLQNNDDTLAEMLARIISVKENLGGGSDSIQQAEFTALAKYSVDTSNLTIEDGSGESDESQIPPQFMSTFMSVVSQKANGLNYVAAALPVSGKTGTLAGRFTGANAGVVGKITGFAGTLADSRTITGYLTAADGTGESFSFFAQGAGITAAANTALDSLASAVYTCGKNITNN